MFARALLVITAAAVCVAARAELATYTPAVLYAPGVPKRVLLSAPVAAGAAAPRALAAELLAAAGADALAADERTVFVVERTGLSAQALAALSDAFVAATPTSRVEAAYTAGADVRAFDRTFGCGRAGVGALGAFLADAGSAGTVAAVCVEGEKEALDAYRAVVAARPTAAVVYTGAAEPEARVADDEDTTIWTGPVAETIVTAIAFIVPIWIVFHLLCSIRPVEDVEYPKHKIA